MRCRSWRLLSALLCLVWNVTGAQSLSGTVHDESDKPLPGAAVFLLKSSDSSLYKTGVTDANGAFGIAPLAAGSYMLKLAQPGYGPYYSSPIVVTNEAVALPPVRLTKAATALKEVAVTAQKPYLEVRADKLVVNVSSSPVNAGSTVLDVLSRSPGVFVDQNDNISLKGRQGVTVMIDGRIQPLSGEELANLLRSMPSASADRIELITNPSAKYDAAGISGIINIRTKRDAKLGLNGSANVNLGQGFYLKGGDGLNLTYRSKKWSLLGNYNYTDRFNYRDIHFYREFDKNGRLAAAYDQHNFSKVRYRSHTASAGADYKLSDKTSIGLLLTGTTYYQGTQGFYLSDVLDSVRQRASYFTTDNQSASNYYSYAPNIHLQHRFDTAGTELTVDLDYGQYINRPRQEFTTSFYESDGRPQQPDYLLIGRISGNTQIRSLKADLTHPLKGEAHIDGGIKSSYVTADNEPLFYDRSSGTELYDSGKSNHFIYHEYINAAYLNAGKEWEGWGLQAGLRAELTTVSGHELTTNQSFDRQYAQFFPSIDITRHMDKDNEATLTLSRRITRPNYQELNPYKFFVDPTTYRAGNPYLLPALEWSAELSHVFRQHFVTSFNYSITNDVIVVVVQPNPAQEKASIQTNQNLTHMHYFGLSGSYVFSPVNWWNSTTNFDAYYSRYEGNLSNTTLNAAKPTFSFYSTNSFTLPRKFIAELTGNYTSPQLYGFLNMKSAWSLGAGIQRSFWDKKATAKLSVADIFHKNIQRGTSTFTGYRQEFENAADTRVVTLDFTWRFGKRTVAGGRLRKGGAEEEKRRVGSS